MVSLKLLLFKILLITALLHVAASSKKEHNSKNSLIDAKKTNGPLNEKQYNLLLEQKLKKKHRKAKRSSYRRQWASPNVDYGSFGKYSKFSGPPPYLVYNRKSGTYFPYYTFPKETAVRRNGMHASRQ